MIFDRTQNDIDSAKKIVEEKVKKFLTLTEEEIDILEKGFLTINSLNRIETAIEDVVFELSNSGYIVTAETKEWNDTDIFFESDFERILNNISKIRVLLPTTKSTPNTPAPSFDFGTINSIEKILHDLKTIEENSRKSIIFSGELFSGEAL